MFTVDELDPGEELDSYGEDCLQRELPTKISTKIKCP
jgi:hypothetical protein